MVTKTSDVVFVARVNQPSSPTAVATYTTVVSVEHFEGDDPADVAEVGLELAPPIHEWGQST